MKLMLRNCLTADEVELAEGGQVNITGTVSVSVRRNVATIRFVFPEDVKEIKYIDKAHRDQKIELP